ncbi:alpha/beta hydrolase [Bdellovibrio bacteriovorus]|uniref:alpha/beta hydrolase n=1 Tax=Bdellovibrio bacteriovorus TaxID=959 RepID=UPI0021D01612|nr:alpha/beta hydrolase [Bdellovibrio bacteriovorus]UXR63558.1 alpha/beta hydrolase [Bdellovibrio bacteriovorus]
MFESICPLAHIVALGWCFLLFAPAKRIRWGWLWYAQILATEWGFATVFLAIVLTLIDSSAIWFLGLAIYSIQSRSCQFYSSDISLPALSGMQKLNQAFVGIWPFRWPPQGETYRLSGEDLSHLKFFPSPGGRVCIHIHGGAWIHGSADQLTYLADVLKCHDYEMVSLNYKKHPEYLLPEIMASVEETFKKISAAYGAEQKFLLYGRSAGGHLALMLAAKFPAQVQAVVALYPVTDFSSLEETATDSDILKTKSWIRNLFAGKENLKSAMSPAQICTAEMPRTLLVHGRNDPVVPIQQSDLLYSHLHELKVPVSYLRFSKGTHGFDALSEGLSMQTFKQALAKVLES